MSTASTTSQRSPWEPLSIRTFRYLWLATLVSNIGTWMHEVGAGWLMTSLTTSPVMVSLVQTAVTLPALFLLLPSGALSEILDRRRYLMTGNFAMGVTATVLGALTITGLITDWSLLGLTFVLGSGMAMIMPAWQAVIPEVVPREQLQGAIALNTMGMNLSRVIGSLIAGQLIALAGSGVVFICNAVTFSFIIMVLWRWRREPPATHLPPEGLRAAMRTGLRYTVHSPALQATILRGIGFFFFASVMWAFLPLIARVLLEGTEQTYSFLFAAVSTGAIVSALLLPRMRQRFDNDQLITWAAVLFAIGITLTATLHVLWVVLPALAICGACWITVMTCSQVSAQTALPNWVRSRGLSVFLTFFMGSLALGPFIWGSVAEFSSIPTAMLIAAVGIVVSSLLSRRWPVSGNDRLDHTPSGHWRKPEPAVPVSPDQGPVMVCIHYHLEPANEAEFLSLMQQWGKARRRDGASDWNLLQDTTREHVYMEYFVVASWLEHLRQHERITRQDARLQLRIRELLKTGTQPEITHYVKPAARADAGDGPVPHQQP